MVIYVRQMRRLVDQLATRLKCTNEMIVTRRDLMGGNRQARLCE